MLSPAPPRLRKDDALASSYMDVKRPRDRRLLTSSRGGLRAARKTGTMPQKPSTPSLLTAIALATYLVPSAYLAIFRGAPGFVAIITVIGTAYGLAAILATTASGILSLRFRETANRAGLQLLSGLPMLATASLPAIVVTVYGEWGSPYWYLVYLFYLPSGALIGAHVALLLGWTVSRRGVSYPLFAASLALAGSLGSPAVAGWLIPIGGWPGAYFLAIGLLVLACVGDLALGISSRWVLAGSTGVADRP